MGLYEDLGCLVTSSSDEIQRAFKRAAFQWHPDRNPGNPDAEANFKRIARAYQVLSDPDRRRGYDEFGDDYLRPGFDPARARAERAWARVRQTAPPYPAPPNPPAPRPAPTQEQFEAFFRSLINTPPKSFAEAGLRLAILNRPPAETAIVTGLGFLLDLALAEPAAPPPRAPRKPKLRGRWG